MPNNITNIRVQPSKKKLFVVEDGLRNIYTYDFSFQEGPYAHYMCLNTSTIYIIHNNGWVRVAKVKLGAKDELLVLEPGNYAFTTVGNKMLCEAWLRAYADHIAEKEIFDV